MSVLKCRASARSAWLSYLSATRFSRRERHASTTIEFGHDYESPYARLNFDRMKEQALGRLVDNPDAGKEQQPSLDEGGEILDLAVPVLMGCVRGPVGNSHGEISDRGGHKIEARMCSLRQNAQAAGSDADNNLQAA